jgi:hypothetical protein
MNDISVPQWHPFLSAFTASVMQDVTPALLGQWMRRTGVRFARDHVLAPAETLADMQVVMNAVWRGLGWGEVVIREALESLELTHRDAPLADAFGTNNVSWAGAFLEGAYEAWMHQLGADARLRMVQTSASEVSSNIVFRFGI